MVSQSASSFIHPFSLVPTKSHSPRTLSLIQLDVSDDLIEYLVDQVVDTVNHALDRPSSKQIAGRGAFRSFVQTVLTRAEITTPTLLVTLIYIARARPYLHIALQEWALERVFLGALIVASKYLNDSTLKNVHWALCTGVFGKRDVGRIEREFLGVLDWELGVSEDEIEGLWDSMHGLVSAQKKRMEKQRMEKLVRVDLAQARRDQESARFNRHPSDSPMSINSASSSSSSLSSSSPSSSASWTPHTPVEIAVRVDVRTEMEVDQPEHRHAQHEQHSRSESRSKQAIHVPASYSIPVPPTSTKKRSWDILNRFPHPLGDKHFKPPRLSGCPPRCEV